jgi:hypothetical protein
VQRESNDPAAFKVSLLFNNQPAPDFTALALGFENQDVVTLNSGEPQAPKFSEAGYVKTVLHLSQRVDLIS